MDYLELSVSKVWDIELDILIVCSHVPDTFEATTFDLVTPALQKSLQHKTAKC